jgi:hypothetical protein
MKRSIAIFLLFCCGCIMASTQQREAGESVERYTRDLLGNPKYFVTVGFSSLEKLRYQTALDSSLNYAHIKGDEYKKMEQYVDSENYQRPDRAPGNIRQLDSIEKNKLFYYVLDYSFRIDSQGHKKLKKYHFELDTAFRVLKMTDITYGRDTRQPEER